MKCEIGPNQEKNDQLRNSGFHTSALFLLTVSVPNCSYSETKTVNRSTSLQPGKIERKPGISQSRHLKTTATTIKTIIVVNRKNQEKNSSQIRRFSFSQTRHLKTGSLIFCPGERISQSRRLAFPRFVTSQFPKSSHQVCLYLVS